MPVLVIAATALELSAALGAEPCPEQGEIAPLRAHGRDLLACVSGLGVVNAALALGRALSRGDVDGVVNLGVAGSFNLNAHPVGSVRLVDKEIWPEYGLLASGWCSADANALGFPLGQARRSGPEPDPAATVWDRVVWDASVPLGRLDLCLGPWTTAKSLTVSGVTADAARADLLLARHRAGLENMEGFALAYGCAMAGVDFVELRAVSNQVGVRPPVSWDLPGALAALGRAAAKLFGAG